MYILKSDDLSFAMFAPSPNFRSYLRYPKMIRQMRSEQAVSIADNKAYGKSYLVGRWLNSVTRDVLTFITTSHAVNQLGAMRAQVIIF
jgi:hypothetical protein